VLGGPGPQEEVKIGRKSQSSKISLIKFSRNSSEKIGGTFHGDEGEEDGEGTRYLGEIKQWRREYKKSFPKHNVID